jgi:hypothetical protein
MAVSNVITSKKLSIGDSVGLKCTDSMDAHLKGYWFLGNRIIKGTVSGIWANSGYLSCITVYDFHGKRYLIHIEGNELPKGWGFPRRST